MSKVANKEKASSSNSPVERKTSLYNNLKACGDRAQEEVSELEYPRCKKRVNIAMYLTRFDIEEYTHYKETGDEPTYNFRESFPKWGTVQREKLKQYLEKEKNEFLYWIYADCAHPLQFELEEYSVDVSEDVALPIIRVRGIYSENRWSQTELMGMVAAIFDHYRWAGDTCLEVCSFEIKSLYPTSTTTTAKKKSGKLEKSPSSSSKVTTRKRRTTPSQVLETTRKRLEGELTTRKSTRLRKPTARLNPLSL